MIRKVKTLLESSQDGVKGRIAIAIGNDAWVCTKRMEDQVCNSIGALHMPTYELSCKESKGATPVFPMTIGVASVLLENRETL